MLSTKSTLPARPVFTLHPLSLRVIGGGEIALSCEAHCQPPSPTYQWYHGDTAIPGSTSKTLLIAHADRGHSGEYMCQATNPHINDPAMRSECSNSVQVVVEKEQVVYTCSPITQGNSVMIFIEPIAMVYQTLA